jgi:F-type H+-transporting ATPase subunit alpha
MRRGVDNPGSDRTAAVRGGFDVAALRRALEGLEGSRVVLASKVYLDETLVRRLTDVLSAVAGRPLHVEMRVNPTQDAGAVLHIGEDHRIVLDPRLKWVADIQRSVSESVETGELASPQDTYAFLRDVLANTEPEARVEELLDTGSVLEVGDGIATVSGLRDVGSQELVEFSGGVYGIAFSLLGDRVGCLLLGAEEGIREGSDVTRTGHLLRVPVGEALQGRMVNALGQPIDGKGPIVPKGYLPVERKAPGVVERQPVDVPLHTGIKVIDALVPLGRGQRELIIGDRKIGKTTIAVDAILAQRGGDVACVYAAIGQKASSVARVVRTLAEEGALARTIVVAALPNEPPAFRYIAPYAACAMGEYFMEQGGDALVVYDDLSKHAVTYREMSALLKRPVGREAYPGDIFYVHSRLLERAARLSDERGAGSLTALPVVETLAGDISAFIPTNVISISDGQMVFDTALFNEGTRPAMDVGLSVSRVGGTAQARLLKQVAGRLRIDLAQYQEMAQFVKFGAEVDAATLQQLARGERSRELLKQPPHLPLSLENEVLVLFGVVNGLFDEVPVEELGEMEEALYDYAGIQQPDAMTVIRSASEITPAVDEALRTTIGAFLDRWRATHGGTPPASGTAASGDELGAAASGGERGTALDGVPGIVSEKVGAVI